MPKKFLLTLTISILLLMLLVVTYLLLNKNLSLLTFINGYFMSGLVFLVIGLLLFLHCAGTWLNIYTATKKLISVFIPLTSLNNSHKPTLREFGFWEKIILWNGIIAFIITGIIALLWF